MKIGIEPVMRGAASGGKAVFGLTLLRLSFVPGGGGRCFACQHIEPDPPADRHGCQLCPAGIALTEQISPQHYADIGTDPSSQVTPPSHAAQGGVIPLVYGQVLVNRCLLFPPA